MKMKIMSRTLATVAGAALLIAPALASAQGVGISGVVGVSGTANSGPTVNLNTDTDVNANVGAGTSSSASGMEGMEMSGPVTVTAADVSGGATLSSSAQVENDSDFAAYARGQMKNNADIQEVNADGSSVTVRYLEHGDLLGIFPIAMTSSAAIDDTGNVSLSHPWYYSLTTTNTDDAALKAALSTEAASTFNTRPSSASVGATSTASGEASLSPNEQAALLADINLALGSALGASASAVSTSTAAQ